MNFNRFSIIAMAWLTLVAAGCNQQSPFVAQTSMSPATSADQAQMVAQMQELNDRLGRFDSDNRDLTNQIAQLQQKLQLSEEEKKLIKQQLGDTAAQLKSIQVAKTDTDKRLNALQASTQFKGGATLTANNSLKNGLRTIQLPGVEVRADGDVVRIEMPSDRLFVQGTTQLQQGGIALIDQISAAVRQNYPRQLVAIEGHTDSTPNMGTVLSAQQLTSTQTMAVYNQMVRSRALPEKQLFTMSMGANQPRFSNGDPAGRSRNRRIELVVYPETYDGT